jgi:beta-glucosidase/6-phospho-beta-glucosidase/beta-galactosidase
MNNKLFQSYLMGGFECSTHRTHSGRRIDVIAATRHDEFAEADYARLMEIGMKTARDGVRWHLIEREPGRYDFSSALNQIRAAKKTGIQIIWDLFHYGYPEDLDLFSAKFPVRFAQFAAAFTEFLLSESNEVPFICPVNEVSFFSWIAGDVGGFYPFERGRGDELKRQLIRTELLSIDAIRQVAPHARFVHTDPAINVLPRRRTEREIRDARNYHDSQFHALDMLVGRREPGLGGAPEYLDIIGLNYYFNNQWRHPGGERIFRDQKLYRPFNSILQEFYERYNRPILIAETGIEDDERASWFHYVAEEAKIARSKGIPVEGVCLYPIVNHPGWDDDRHCHNGLWCYPNEKGDREIYRPLAEEVKRQIGEPEMKYFAAHN